MDSHVLSFDPRWLCFFILLEIATCVATWFCVASRGIEKTDSWVLR